MASLGINRFRVFLRQFRIVPRPLGLFRYKLISLPDLAVGGRRVLSFHPKPLSVVLELLLGSNGFMRRILFVSFLPTSRQEYLHRTALQRMNGLNPAHVTF